MLNKLGSAQVSHAVYLVHRLNGAKEEDFLNVFTIYGHVGNLRHMVWTTGTNFSFPFPKRFHMIFGFNRPGGV